MSTAVAERRGRGIRRKPQGRPTTYHPRIGQRIATKVAKGTPLGVAAEAIGVPSGTATMWYCKGCDDPNGTFASFAELIGKARAKAVETRLARITEVAKGGQTTSKTTVEKANGDTTTSEKYLAPQWTADAWVLERTESELFGRRQQVEHSGEVTKRNININVALNESQAVQLSAILSQSRIECSTE